ncbi:hypothetical protein TW95_gp0829 [Pandoravirus inopinatum]|uniref:Uncharacterized protein n=1 Tax=Pandoravirus inopinatum TaxID=1605721 RepID=A0A0B5IXP6_9VIRU|nr:hypothetical protein TW95_gp0829 [Pandoravirus inopinatum]AJF97563.1 hypothetical protein [Pandoravirus inopinatum]
MKWKKDICTAARAQRHFSGVLCPLVFFATGGQSLATTRLVDSAGCAPKSTMQKASHASDPLMTTRSNGAAVSTALPMVHGTKETCSDEKAHSLASLPTYRKSRCRHQGSHHTLLPFINKKWQFNKDT